MRPLCLPPVRLLQKPCRVESLERRTLLAASTIDFVAAGQTVSNAGGTVEVIVQRAGDTSGPASVDYATADGTASDGADYTGTVGVLNFAPFETTESIFVSLADQPDAPATQDFTVALTNASAGDELGLLTTHIVTLQNDRAPVSLSAASYGATTDDARADVVLHRGGNTTIPVTVHYATSDGTATDGVDYTAASGTVHFDPGETTKTVHVALLGNYAAAGDLDFDFALSDPAGGAVLTGTSDAAVTVANPHSIVQLGASDYGVSVHDGMVTLAVTRGGNLASPASVDYATADGSATDGEDYFGNSGTLAFAPGEAIQFVEVSVLGDAASPASRTFGVSLSAPDGNARLGAVTSATVEIQNSDSVVQFASAEYSVSADEGTATLTITRAGNTSLPGTVDYATADDSAHASRDYTARSGTVSFDPGQASRTISVPVLVHASGAPSVSFTVGLSGENGAFLGSRTTAVVTVRNEHSVVEFDAPAETVSNDDGVASLVVRRTGNTSLAGAVAYATFSDTAVAGTDYAAETGVLSFAAGQETGSIPVSLLLNPLAPAPRVFGVTLSDAAGGAVIGHDDTARVTVTNLHSVVGFAATTYAARESDGAVTFTLSRAGNIDEPASINFATADGTAVAGADYVGAAGVISFSAGQSAATFDVTVNPDLEFDPDETFTVTLSNPADGAILGAAMVATVTLADTSPPPSFAGGGLVSTQGSGRLDGVSLSFDQAVEAPPVTAFSLFQRSIDRPGLPAHLNPVPIADATYDPATHGVTVKPGKALRSGVFYQLVVDGAMVHNAGGKQLDGDGSGEGSALVVTFGRGRKLRYVDHDGDAVQLSLKGPGVMELVRREDGEGERLTLSGTSAATRLLGTIRPARAGSDGQTTLETISGLGAATSLLSDAFDVGQIL